MTSVAVAVSSAGSSAVSSEGSFFEKMSTIMDSYDKWEAEWDNPSEKFDSCSLSAHMGMARARDPPPNYCYFHSSQPELGILVAEWSKFLPSLPFGGQVAEVGRVINKLNEKGSGRDFYAVEYILKNVEPTVYTIFIKALIGAIVNKSVSDCVITDCSIVHNPEGLYKMTHRSNFKTFSKYGPLTSLIPFIRMIRSYDKYIETVKTEIARKEPREWYIKSSTERIAEIDVLRSCTDFSMLYDKQIFTEDGTTIGYLAAVIFAKLGTTIAYVGHPDDYFKSEPIPLTKKVFDWINNPKEIFEFTMGLEADWTVTFAGDYDRLYAVLSSLESRF